MSIEKKIELYKRVLAEYEKSSAKHCGLCSLYDMMHRTSMITKEELIELNWDLKVYEKTKHEYAFYSVYGYLWKQSDRVPRINYLNKQISKLEECLKNIKT